MMYSLIQKTSLQYNRVVGSRFFPFFNFVLKILNPISKLILNSRITPQFAKGIAHLNIYYFARYNCDFNQFFSKRLLLIKFLTENVTKSNVQSSSCENPIFIKTLLLDHSIESGSYNKARLLFNEIYRSIPETQEYRIFAEKKLLYIGSAPSTLTGVDFSKFDLVLVNNFLEEQLKLRGIPVEKAVIFFNQGFAQRNLLEIKKISKICKAIFIKDKNNTDYPAFIEATLFQFNDYGSMGAQNVLLAAVLGSASEITVHGVNGFLSEAPFTEGLKKYQFNKQHISNILRRHELISNHNFLILISKLIKVRGNSDFLELVNLSTSRYASLINEKYGKFSAKRIAGYGF